MLIKLLFLEIWDSGVARTNQTSRWNLFVKIVNGLNPLILFAKSSILDVRSYIYTQLIKQENVL